MRQSTQYTCGPAVILTIINALNPLPSNRDYCSMTEQKVAEETKTRPILGTENDDLVDYLKNHPDTKSKIHSYGEDTYHNGLAIANIRNWRSGIGHFVVFLGLDQLTSDNVLIYDPLDGQIHSKNFSQFEWLNAKGDLSNWSINFETADNELEVIIDKLRLLDKKMIHVIKGEHDEFNPIYDTVSFLYEHHLKNQDLINLTDDSHINILNNELYMGSIKVNKGDTVWVKIDPRQSEKYFLTLRLMVPFENQGIEFINPPSLVLAFDDKTIPLVTKESKDRVFINNKNRIKQSLYAIEETDLIVKRLNGFGGRDVFFTKSDEQSISKLLKPESPYIIEKSIANTGENIDTRLFWYRGKIVGAVNRYGSGNKHCNMSQGGGFKLGNVEEILSNQEINKQVTCISDFLESSGFVIAGIDVLNGKLITEVNVSNPSVFKNYIEMSGDNFLFNQ